MSKQTNKQARIQRARKWLVYGNMAGGWYAWNGEARKTKNLISKGSFCEAVSEFEKQIGPYYESR